MQYLDQWSTYLPVCSRWCVCDHVITLLGNQLVARLLVAARQQSPVVVYHALVGVGGAAIKISRIENVNLTATSTVQCFLIRIFPLVVAVTSNGINQAVLVGWRRIHLLAADGLDTHTINFTRSLWTGTQSTDLVEAGAGKEAVKSTWWYRV